MGIEVTSETTATTATPQAGETVVVPQPQAGNKTSAEPQAGEAPESMSLEEAKKLRKEAQALRARIKAIDEAEESKRLETLTEVERIKAEVEKSKQREAETTALIKSLREQNVDAQVRLAAQAKGSRDHDLVAMAVKSYLEYDEDGTVNNLDKALDKLAKNKPLLFEQKAADTETPASPATTANTPNAPATPPSNPGRSSIVSPLATPSSNGKYVAPTWNSIYNKS